MKKAKKKKKVADLPRYNVIFGYEKEFMKAFDTTIKHGVKSMISKMKELNDTNIKSSRRGTINTR